MERERTCLRERKRIQIYMPKPYQIGMLQATRSACGEQLYIILKTTESFKGILPSLIYNVALLVVIHDALRF